MTSSEQLARDCLQMATDHPDSSDAQIQTLAGIGYALLHLAERLDAHE